MPKYCNTIGDVTADMLTGFFVGWPNPPTPSVHLGLLRDSYRFWVAIDSDAVVGFITAISDGTLSAYIPLLEVLPAFQGRGIGTELLRLMLDSLQGLYMVDLACDEALVAFYQRFAMVRGSAMMLRNYDRQAGR